MKTDRFHKLIAKARGHINHVSSGIDTVFESNDDEMRIRRLINHLNMMTAAVNEVSQAAVEVATMLAKEARQ